MSGHDVGREDRAWPAWLEALRPDELARARMRRGILSAAAPLLATRRSRRSWWQVAADWSSVAVPIAAAIALLFAWIAYDSAPPGSEQPERVEMEALVRPAVQTAPPDLLLNRSEPSTDGVLAATLQRPGR